ncbi:uncharacterized protein LOC144539706 isoform X1 [Centroberyx gerrardi]
MWTPHMFCGILIGLHIITKVMGFSNGIFSQSCGSMSPQHKFSGNNLYPQDSVSPFYVNYTCGNEGEPFTVHLSSTQFRPFRGFMLQARESDTGHAVGTFILLKEYSQMTRLLACNDLEGSAVSQKNNQKKTFIQVNWTAPVPRPDIVFRATFVEDFKIFWEEVDINISTQASTTTTTTTTQPTTPGGITSSPTTITSNPTASNNTTTTTTTTSQPSTPGGITSSPTTITSNPTASNNTTTTTTTTTQPSTPGGITSSPTTITSNPTASNNTTPTTPTSDTTTGKPPPYRYRLLIQLAVTCITFTKIFYTAILSYKEFTVRSSPHPRHSWVFKTLCRLLTLIAETVALILLFICYSVPLIVLVCVLMFLSLLELFLVLLPIGISHELKDICDSTVKVASVIHEIFTIATIFVGLIKIEESVQWEQSWEVCWCVKVVAGYTAWRFLFYIYVFTRHICRGKTLRGGKIGSCKTHSKSKNQGEMMKCGAKIDFAFSIIFYFGNAAFAVAVIVGIFS